VDELLWRPWLLKRSRILGVSTGTTLTARARVPDHEWPHRSALGRVHAPLQARARPLWRWPSSSLDPMAPGCAGLRKLHLRREYMEKAVGSSRVLLSDGPAPRIELPAGRFWLCLVGGAEDGYRLAKAFAHVDFPEDASGAIKMIKFWSQINLAAPRYGKSVLAEDYMRVRYASASKASDGSTTRWVCRLRRKGP
jgi:hypothetical protein